MLKSFNYSAVFGMIPNKLELFGMIPNNYNGP